MYNYAHHNGQATVLKLRRGLKTEAQNLMESTIAKATERSAHAIVRRLVSKEDVLAAH